MRKLFVFVVLWSAFGASSGEKVVATECFRNFDGPDVAWQLVDRRAGTSLVSHRCVGDDAREGSGSERVTITAPGGESLHFICPAGRIPVLDELEARMWVKANRPGVSLAARVVLPRSIDEKTGAAKTAIIAGDECATAGRWQQLRLAEVPNRLAAQVRVLRATRGANIDAREAYVDAIVLVVPGGPGNTVAWTDALEIDGVVLAAAIESAAESAATPQTIPALFSSSAPQQRQPQQQNTATVPPQPVPPQQVATEPPAQFQGTTLMVGGRPFLMRGVEWHFETFAFLAARGFNTVWLNQPPTSEQTASATRAGLWLICPPPSPDDLATSGIDPAWGRVLAWNLGSPAGPRDLESMRRWVELVRGRDPLIGRPILITPRGDWHLASRLADVLVADHPAAATLSQRDFEEWLQALPRLARPGTPLWVRIPTQPGPRTRLQLDALPPETSSAPTLIEDHQLDALVTAAATNDCRGFLFQSDSPLDAQDEITQRRAMLLEEFNNRLESMSPWLTIGKRIGDAASTDSTAGGVVLQAERARLLVPTSRAASESDATTAAKKSIAFVVPGVPESNEAFLLSPVELRSLNSKRVAGGTRVTVDRSAAGMLLMTEDSTVIANYRKRIAQTGTRAAQLQFALASNSARSLAILASRLQRIGVSTKQLDAAIGSANVELRTVNSLLSAGNFAAAYERSSTANEILSAAREHARRKISSTPEFNSVPLAVDAGSLLRLAEFEKSLAMLRGGENLSGRRRF